MCNGRFVVLDQHFVGTADVTGRVHHRRQIVGVPRRSRRQRQRTLQHGRGDVVAFQTVKRQTQLVVQFGVIGRRRERLLKQLRRLRIIFLLEIQPAQIRQRVGVVRVDRQRPVVTFDRLFELAGRLEQLTVGDVNLGLQFARVGTQRQRILLVRFGHGHRRITAAKHAGGFGPRVFGVAIERRQHRRRRVGRRCQRHVGAPRLGAGGRSDPTGFVAVFRTQRRKRRRASGKRSAKRRTSPASHRHRSGDQNRQSGSSSVFVPAFHDNVSRSRVPRRMSNAAEVKNVHDDSIDPPRQRSSVRFIPNVHILTAVRFTSMTGRVPHRSILTGRGRDRPRGLRG